MDKITFDTKPGFCPDCGTILPILNKTGGISCYGCKRDWGAEVFGDMAISYTLHFNDKDAYASSTSSSVKKNGENADDNEADGPVVERRCPQCQNEKMSYATLQLRSADEGQTVFYTCTKCKFKETENS